MIICGQYVIIELNHMWFAHNHMWSWPNPHIWGIDMFVYDSYTNTHIPILTMFICEHAEKWSYTNTHIPILAMFICEHAEKWSYTCTHIPTLAMFIGEHVFGCECSHVSSHTKVVHVHMWSFIYQHSHTNTLVYSYVNTHVCTMYMTHMWALICELWLTLINNFSSTTGFEPGTCVTTVISRVS